MATFVVHPVNVRASVIGGVPGVPPTLVGGTADEVWDDSNDSYSVSYTTSSEGFQTWEPAGDVLPLDFATLGNVTDVAINLRAKIEGPGATAAMPNCFVGPLYAERPSSGDPDVGYWTTGIKLGNPPFGWSVSKPLGEIHDWEGELWHDDEVTKAYSLEDIADLFAEGFSVALFQSHHLIPPSPPPGGPKATYYAFTFTITYEPADPEPPPMEILGDQRGNRLRFYKSRRPAM